MALKNINVLQSKSDLAYLTSYTDQYLYQALANMGQRYSIKGDGIVTKSFLFDDLFDTKVTDDDNTLIGKISINEETEDELILEFSKYDYINKFYTDSFLVPIKNWIKLSQFALPVPKNNISHYGLDNSLESTIKNYTLVKLEQSNNIIFQNVGYKEQNNVNETYEFNCQRYDITNQASPLISALGITKYKTNFVILSYITKISNSVYNIKYMPLGVTIDTAISVVKNYEDGVVLKSEITPEKLYDILVNTTSSKIVLNPGQIESININYNNDVNIKLSFSGSNDLLSSILVKYNNDITYLYPEIKERFSNNLFYLNEDNDYLKKLIIGHLFAFIRNNNSQTVKELYIPLDYQFYYNCNDRDSYYIYNNNVSVPIQFLGNDYDYISTDTFIEMKLKTAIFCQYSGDTKCALFDFNIDYDGYIESIIYNISISGNYTLPYINNENFWVINNTISKVCALGLNAGTPNIILTFNSKNNFTVNNENKIKPEILFGANENKILDSLNWEKTTVLIKPISELTNTDSQNDVNKGYSVDTLIPNLQKIDEINNPDSFNDLKYALLVSLSLISTNEDESCTSDSELINIIKYGTIASFWKMIYDESNEVYKFELINNPANNKYALDFNFLTNVSGMVKYSTTKIPVNYPFNFKFSYLFFEDKIATLKNNSSDSDLSYTYYPTFTVKNANDYEINTTSKNVNDVNSQYKNNLNLGLSFFDTIEKLTDDSNYYFKCPTQSSKRYWAYNNIGKGEGSDNYRNTNIIYSYNTYNNLYEEYLPNYDLPIIDFKEVLQRNINIANRVNILSFDSDTQIGGISTSTSSIFYSYIGTSFNSANKNILHLGTSSYNINLGNETLVSDYNTFEFKKQSQLDIDFNNITNNGYVTNNKDVYNNRNIWEVNKTNDVTYYSTTIKNIIGKFGTWKPVSMYVYDNKVSYYINLNSGLDESNMFSRFYFDNPSYTPYNDFININKLFNDKLEIVLNINDDDIKNNIKCSANTLTYNTSIILMPLNGFVSSSQQETKLETSYNYSSNIFVSYYTDKNNKRHFEITDNSNKERKTIYNLNAQ